MKISNYSLNYTALLNQGDMDLFGFLALCRELGLEAGSDWSKSLIDNALCNKTTHPIPDRFLQFLIALRIRSINTTH